MKTNQGWFSGFMSGFSKIALGKSLKTEKVSLKNLSLESKKAALSKAEDKRLRRAEKRRSQERVK